MNTDRLSLGGRRALVCGASKGIGCAAAVLLASRGADVTLLARSLDALESICAGIRAGGGKASPLVADLDDRDGLARLVDTELQDRGPFHILVNNTGGPPGGALLEAESEAILAALSRHLLASHQLMQAVLPGMREAGYGRIVNVLSTSVREPIPNLGVSNLTRAAMAAWSKTLADELPPGVTINSILPGFTDTDRLTSLGQSIAENSGKSLDEVRAAWVAQIPEGRLADASETAEAIAFLVSPAASYIRGHCLPVDGGRLRSI